MSPGMQSEARPDGRRAHRQSAQQGEGKRTHDVDRVEWVDYAKGICIILVVTLYATHHVHQLTHASGWMQHVVDFAQPFRMPDFFLISGLFVSRVIDRPLRSYIDTKILHFVYFYALWVTFRFTYTDLRHVLDADKFAVLSGYLHLYVQPPDGPLWFIYILSLFFLAVRLLRRVPAPLVLAGAAVLQVANFNTGLLLFDKFTHYFVFFYSGHIFARHVLGTAAWAQSHAAATVATLAGWFLVNWTLVELGFATRPGVSLLMGYAGAFAVLLLATLLSRVRWTHWLRYLGQHSIVVYLGFVLPLALMRGLISERLLIHDIGNLALVVTVVSVAGAMMLYWMVRNTPFRFLFARPAWAAIAARPASLPRPAGERVTLNQAGE
ncbi:acyltransferase family protein [Noviherbaspirillum sp.]|uniref:acyltransferase family protein n=1 Tax=Noviherbaspirillum sp. TaxID=1926288 RepID=UPI002B4809FE|nr:acyltransferase family protein [Noviherbaspirillum sp.]HJV81846.1 acyltransferase family protein [Noviherbaspirillum sp.]